MRNFLKILIIPFLAVFLCGGSAMAYTIEDNYIGAAPTSTAWNGRDVIGVEDLFGVHRMTVDINRGMGMQVSINSSYFNNIGQYQTTLGDLFISTDGWNPSGTAPYTGDNSANGEDWEYAMVLAASGVANLYAVTDEDSIVLSSAPNGYIYRRGQEVSYTPGLQNSLGEGSWSINTELDWLTFDIPWIEGWNDVAVFGFHWTMSCGNDVIEGAAPVPEPATMLLLGTGLIGLAGIGRRKFFKK